MDFLLIGFILALIPILSWFIQYFLSKREGKLNLFRKHLSVYYFDWIFVAFNFFWVYVVSFNFNLMMYSLLISLVATILIHIFWKNLHLKEKKPVYMFDFKKKKITLAGIWHVFYHLIQLFLVILFLISDVSNVYSYLALFCLLFFFVGATSSSSSSRSIHGRGSITDIPFLILGFLIIFVKLLRSI